jgi:predicted CXXCH cytochrome family protein
MAVRTFRQTGPRLWASVSALCVALLILTAPHSQAEESAHYVGAAACAGCHAGETALWKTSHHAMSMQPATPATVLGDFNNATFVNGPIATTFHRSANDFMIRTDGPDGAMYDYKIAYTFGVYPLQQYLIELPGGRFQAFTIAWDSRPKQAGGQRWYSLYPNETLTAGDRLHWTGRDMTWNYQCADCHSTDLRKNYDLASDTYKTTFTDVDVGCEACHGPGSRHITWSATKPADPGKGLTTRLPPFDPSVWLMNEATGIAQRTTPQTSSAEIDACGGCHARASTIAPDRSAATPFLDAHLPALLDAGHYHADGQIDGEMFEYGSFVQSRMYRAGVTCTNCHEPHAAKLRAEGNGLCAQCHMPAKFDVAAHTHHEAGSAGAQCVNCHMPTKTYMGVDVRRDHSIRVPRPDLSASLGTPNACTNCHADKSADWAAKAVAGWFPNGRQTQPQYGQALSAGRQGSADAEKSLDKLAANPDAPPIARASALLLLPGVATSASLPIWHDALADPDPLVRLGAVRAPLAPEVAADIAPRLSDPVRAVRIEAARSMAGVDPQTLTPAQRADLASALHELIASEMISADRAEAHLNLGLLYVRQKRPDDAEAEYRTALRLDPKFVPALVNLADLQRMRGRDGQGVDLLQQAIALEPANPEAHHALGLLLVRQHNYPAAVAELHKASDLAPDNARFGYTYAIALNSTGSPKQALTLLQHLHQRFPDDQDVATALVSMSLDAGDQAAALTYGRDLARLQPDNVQLGQLIRSLEHVQPR